MISLILPYWDRQEAADKALKSLEIYKDLDLEIIVVDDGNKIPFKTPDSPLNIRVITLPRKDIPKSCVTPWNRGVDEAKGDIVILSCIEILHEEPIIAQMKQQLEEIGRNGYVLASAWCPEFNEWHCHSSIRTPRNVWGTGLSFFGMMYKGMYKRVGGYNEKYRDGAGYEDNDFINRMLSSGAQFKIRDDLKVIHPKSGATTKWPAGSFERNESLFKEEWKDRSQEKIIHFVCVNWGNYCGRGVEYVNNLYASTLRNVMGSMFFKFTCFSDATPDGLMDGITVRPLPEGVNGWWNKLYLFKEDLFPKNERIVFLDLDTVITGDITDIISYKGEFATLWDFYSGIFEGFDRYAPAIMMWESGFGSDIWQSYEDAGYPTDLPLGDLSWINQHFSKMGYKPDIIQELYPDKIKSYKANRCQNGVNGSTSIVCFHGKPRPHEVGGWVTTHWNNKLLSELKVNITHNKSDVVEQNMRSCIKRGLPEVNRIEDIPIDKPIAIVGGSPSLKDHIEELRNFDGYILATNGAYAFLRKHGIKPQGMCLLDARNENLRFFQNPSRKTTYFIASCASPLVFNKLKGHKVIVWHSDNGIYRPDGKMYIGGGCTVGTRAIFLAYVLGFRDIHLFGMDSCYTDDEHHAYSQDLNDGERLVNLQIGGREFKCAIWMAGQAEDFKKMLSNFGHLFDIQVHGNGLLRAILDEAWKIHMEKNNVNV